MEDEIQKRNTDCVYFLASPLTCKKGNECEYRHSDIARLNPRDCWYWLNSNCLNPTCAFRHPPLEGFRETVTESVQPPAYAAVSSSKLNVPCYFYFNAYCIKGDQCPFLHDTVPSQKFPKTASEAISIHHPEFKTSTGSDTGPASVEVPANASGDNSELIKQYQSKEVLQQPAPASALEEPSPSMESSVPECEEPAIKSSETPVCPAEYVNGSPHLSADQGSEDNMKECAEPEEWWESSPGFDVLVDDGSEKLAYEDDADYLLARERESEMLRSNLLQYDYEVPVGYDPIGYPDGGYLYDHNMYDGYDRMDDRFTPEYFERVSECSRERNLEPMICRRRKPSRKRHDVDGRDDMDLRDHLRKHRRTGASEVSQNSRKRHCSRNRSSSREQYARRNTNHLLHGRLASEVGTSMIVSSLSETESALNDFHRQGWPGYPQSSRLARSRLRERERRRRNRKPTPIISPEISQGLSSKRAETSQAKNAATFTGPKTLAQIKEEKKRAKPDGNSCEGHIPQRLRKPASAGFAGPKPLNELLKDKRRPMSAGGDTNGSAGMAPKHEHLELSGSWVGTSSHAHAGDDGVRYHGTAKEQDNGYGSDFEEEEEEDDDDDALRKKLAHILSQ